MPKRPRQSFLIEKCTELGMAALIPITTDRSIVHPNQSHLTKYRKTTLEAAKQCGRYWLPKLYPPMTFNESLDRIASDQRAAIAQPNANTTFTDWLRGAKTPMPVQVGVWIGPEGGWTPDELDAASQHNLTAVPLANTVLRIETAAITAAALAQNASGPNEAPR